MKNIIGTVHFVDNSMTALESQPYSFQKLIDALHLSDGATVSDIVLNFNQSGKNIVIDIQPNRISISIDGVDII